MDEVRELENHIEDLNSKLVKLINGNVDQKTEKLGSEIDQKIDKKNAKLGIDLDEKLQHMMLNISDLLTKYDWFEFFKTGLFTS